MESDIAFSYMGMTTPPVFQPLSSAPTPLSDIVLNLCSDTLINPQSTNKKKVLNPHVESIADFKLNTVELNSRAESNIDTKLFEGELNSGTVLRDSNTGSELNAVELNSIPMLDSTKSNTDSKMSMMEMNFDPLLNSVELSTDSKLNTAVELDSDLILNSIEADDPILESDINFLLNTEESDGNTSLNESFSLHYYSNDDDDTMSLSSISQEIDCKKYVTPEPEELQICKAIDITTKEREIDSFADKPDTKKFDEKSQQEFGEEGIDSGVETEKGQFSKENTDTTKIPESQHTNVVNSDTSVYYDRPISSHKTDVTTTTTRCLEQCSPRKFISRSLSPQIHLLRTTPSKTPSPTIIKPKEDNGCLEQVTKGHSETKTPSHVMVHQRVKRKRKVKEHGEVGVSRRSLRNLNKVHEMHSAKKRQTTRKLSFKNKGNELTKKVNQMRTKLRTMPSSKIPNPKHTKPVKPVKPVKQVSKGLSKTKFLRPLAKRKIQVTKESSTIDTAKQRRSKNKNGAFEISLAKRRQSDRILRNKNISTKEKVNIPRAEIRAVTSSKMLNQKNKTDAKSIKVVEQVTKGLSGTVAKREKKENELIKKTSRNSSEKNIIKSVHSSVMSKRPQKRPRETPTESNTTQKEGNQDNHSPSSGTEEKDKKDVEGKNENTDDGGKRRAPKKRRLSRRSDESNSPLKNWKCAFCGFGNNEKFLGYLFGPYSCTLNVEEEGDNGEDNEKEIEDEKDVWMHAQCAYWSPGVCLVGNEVKGLSDALSMGRKMTCQCCERLGATLCCVLHKCKKTFHYPCAVEEDCSFNPDNFTITCPRHKRTRKD